MRLLSVSKLYSRVWQAASVARALRASSIYSWAWQAASVLRLSVQLAFAGGITRLLSLVNYASFGSPGHIGSKPERTSPINALDPTFHVPDHGGKLAYIASQFPFDSEHADEYGFHEMVAHLLALLAKLAYEAPAVVKATVKRELPGWSYEGMAQTLGREVHHVGAYFFTNKHTVVVALQGYQLPETWAWLSHCHVAPETQAASGRGVHPVIWRAFVSPAGSGRDSLLNRLQRKLVQLTAGSSKQVFITGHGIAAAHAAVLACALACPDLVASTIMSDAQQLMSSIGGVYTFSGHAVVNRTLRLSLQEACSGRLFRVTYACDFMPKVLLGYGYSPHGHHYYINHAGDFYSHPQEVTAQRVRDSDWCILYLVQSLAGIWPERPSRGATGISYLVGWVGWCLQVLIYMLLVIAELYMPGWLVRGIPDYLPLAYERKLRQVALDLAQALRTPAAKRPVLRTHMLSRAAAQHEQGEPEPADLREDKASMDAAVGSPVSMVGAQSIVRKILLALRCLRSALPIGRHYHVETAETAKNEAQAGPVTSRRGPAGTALARATEPAEAAIPSTDGCLDEGVRRVSTPCSTDLRPLQVTPVSLGDSLHEAEGQPERASSTSAGHAPVHVPLAATAPLLPPVPEAEPMLPSQPAGQAEAWATEEPAAAASTAGAALQGHGAQQAPQSMEATTALPAISRAAAPGIGVLPVRQPMEKANTPEPGLRPLPDWDRHADGYRSQDERNAAAASEHMRSADFVPRRLYSRDSSTCVLQRSVLAIYLRDATDVRATQQMVTEVISSDSRLSGYFHNPSVYEVRSCVIYMLFHLTKEDEAALNQCAQQIMHMDLSSMQPLLAQQKCRAAMRDLTAALSKKGMSAQKAVAWFVTSKSCRRCITVTLDREAMEERVELVDVDTLPMITDVHLVDPNDGSGLSALCISMRDRFGGIPVLRVHYQGDFEDDTPTEVMQGITADTEVLVLELFTEDPNQLRVVRAVPKRARCTPFNIVACVGLWLVDYPGVEMDLRTYLDVPAGSLSPQSTTPEPQHPGRPVPEASPSRSSDGNLVLICNAKDDRDKIANPLQDKLSSVGIEAIVDWDKYSLGKDLSSSKREALIKATGGIVILSEEVFTEEELVWEVKALVKRRKESPRMQMLLPIFWGVTREYSHKLVENMPDQAVAAFKELLNCGAVHYNLEFEGRTMNPRDVGACIIEIVEGCGKLL